MAISIGIGNYIRNQTQGGGLPSWVKNSMEFWYDVKKQKATNESLKANPELKDFSGKDRPLRLYNFDFAENSGVGDYYAYSFQPRGGYIQIKWTIVNDRKIVGRPNKDNTFGYYTPANKSVIVLNWNVSGIKDGNNVYVGQYTNITFGATKLVNGHNYITIDTTVSNKPNYGFVNVWSDDTYTTDITIEQVKYYPNALVTDGVDDYGLVQNMDHGVRTLFYVCNPFTLDQILYDERWMDSVGVIQTTTDSIAYPPLEPFAITYINGNKNTTITSNELIGTKHIIVRENKREDTKSPHFFCSMSTKSTAALAFYSAIGFNRVLSQEEIDWVIAHLIDTSDTSLLNAITSESGTPILTELNKQLITESY